MSGFSAVACLGLSLFFTTVQADTGSMTEKSIAQRLQPQAQVTISGHVDAPIVQAAVDPGEKTYHQVCHTCHEGGLLGAPKFGDKDAWQKRIAQGMDVLLMHATKGFKAMPPKGGCGTCTDEDIHHAIQYMVSQIK